MRRHHWHPPLCKVCGKSNPGGERVSQTGLCHSCGKSALNANVDQMEARSGPNWTKWRRAMVLCAHPELLDVLDQRP